MHLQVPGWFSAAGSHLLAEPQMAGWARDRRAQGNPKAGRAASGGSRVTKSATGML